MAAPHTSQSYGTKTCPPVLTLPNCFSVFLFEHFLCSVLNRRACNSPPPPSMQGPRAKEVFQLVVNTPTPPPIRLILIFSSVYVCTVVAVAHEITFSFFRFVFHTPSHAAAAAAAAAAAPPTPCVPRTPCGVIAAANAKRKCLCAIVLTIHHEQVTSRHSHYHGLRCVRGTHRVLWCSAPQRRQTGVICFKN